MKMSSLTADLAESLLARLVDNADKDVAKGMQRYFPTEQLCFGVTAKTLDEIARSFLQQHKRLELTTLLGIADQLMKLSAHNETVLLAFLLPNKKIASGNTTVILRQAERWLERRVTNWAQTDALAMKTLYLHFLKQPHALSDLTPWLSKSNPWCKRAAYVVWLKFIDRKIGRDRFSLPVNFIFEKADLCLNDEDVYVQKAVGWFLKVASVTHKEEVIEYLSKKHEAMWPSTVRYACEKLNRADKARVKASNKRD